MKTDVSVISMAQDSGDYAVSLLLLFLTFEERAEKLEELFLLAVRKPADEVALKFYKLLQQSFHDIEATPRVEETDGTTVYTRDAMDAMRSRSDRACTLKTMELYGKIAGFKMLAGGNYIRDEKWIAPKEVILPETKKAMLDSVFSRWENTDDDKEADACFHFLRVAFNFASSHEEEKWFDKKMRDVTDRGFPLLRLVRHSQLIPLPTGFSSDWKSEKIAEILGIGLVKTIRKTELAKVLRSVQPLLEIPMNLSKCDNDYAFALSEKKIKETVRFDTAVKELLKIMQPEGWSKDSVPGKIELAPPQEIGRVEILIEANTEFLPRQGARYDKNEGHGWFNLASEHVCEWRRQYPQYTVDLKLVVKSRYAIDPLFEMKESFYQ